MKTLAKIEKKGYRVTSNIGWRNGEQTIVSVSAEKNNRKIRRDNLTQLLKSLGSQF